MRIGHHALAAERIAGIELLAGAGMFRPGIDFPGCFDLFLRQAGAGFRLAAAGKRGDVEAACGRSEEHTSELQSLMRISYAVFCLKKKNRRKTSEDSSETSVYTN